MKVINAYDTLSTSKDTYIEVAENVKLYVKDYGQGKPVILIHGWPLSNEMWEYQVEELVANNFRVITYDRRGFGKSSQPWDGYNYDTLADDLKIIIDELKLTDITLVGFSMGGGEVARYFSRHAGKGVSKAVLISSILPFRLKTEDNPEGTPQTKFDETAAAIREDRIGFLDGFGKIFFGVNILSKPISTPLLDYYKMLGAMASQRATLQCLIAFSSTDFRNEMGAINVPVLVIHGDADETVPIELSSDKAVTMLSEYQYIKYENAPHGLFYTEKHKLNQDLISFIRS